MGVAQLGAVIRFIPDPVIVGFTSGIAVVIWVGQWKDFFGLHPAPSGQHFHEKLWALLRSFDQVDLPTTAIAVTALAILVVGNRVFDRVPLLRRVPAPLIAMLAAMAIQGVGKFPSVATIGSAFGGLPRTLPGFAWPDLTIAQALTLIGPAFTIALLGAIESLLAAVVADGMAGTQHDPNQELLGQGVANVLAPLFGGFAATGAIARTATNIRNGATSPLAGVVHAVFLVLVIVLLAPLAAGVPLAALAAILFFIAWNMSDAKHFMRLLLHFPRADRIVLVITFVLTVFVDLVVAVNVGVVVTALLFMRRMANTVNIEPEHADTPGTPESPAPAQSAGTMIYRIDGPFFFGAAEKLASALARVQGHIEVGVLCMHRVPFIDATGLETLAEIIERFQKRKVRVILCDVQPDVLTRLSRVGITNLIGEGNLLSSADVAPELDRRRR
jgi:sulfate permease, SulP family